MSWLRIQAVLYQHDPAVVDRWLGGVAATVRRAVDAGLGRSTTVVLGDCSPAPVVGSAQRTRWAGALGTAGVAFDVVDFGANLGHGGGQNALAGRADDDTELLLVLNPDGLPAPTMLSELVRALESGVAAVEARQSPFEHPKAYDPRTGSTSWVSGAAVLLRREAFDAVGGFDDASFFLHGDDVDLSWRLRLAGWRLKHVPEAVYFHDKRLDAAGRVIAPPSEQRYGPLGALMLLHKYSRPDALNHWEYHITESGSDAERAAVAEFRRRRMSGQLPEPIDPQHDVSEVIGASFGPTRF